MRLLVLGGFLGSGKTTLLLELARKLVATSQRIAIIENEVGEVGVDGKYLSQEGLEVQELFGGCVCCTLSAGLVSTLEKIERLFAPDLIILEATGLARPGDIVKIVHSYLPRVESIVVLTLVDAARYDMLSTMLTPLLTAQIQAAHIVAINKIDEVDADKVRSIAASVSQLNSLARVVTVSAEKRINLDQLLLELT